MAIKNIIQKINSEAEKEMQSIEKQAEKQIQKILAQAKEQAQKIKAKALENFRIEKLEEAKLILREKKNEGYRIFLERKKAIIDSVFQQALEKLKKSGTEKLIAQLKKELPENGEIIEDKSGGFKFVAETVEIDSTFPSLIAEARQKLETKIAKILYA